MVLTVRASDLLICWGVQLTALTLQMQHAVSLLSSPATPGFKCVHLESLLQVCTSGSLHQKHSSYPHCLTQGDPVNAVVAAVPCVCVQSATLALVTLTPRCRVAEVTGTSRFTTVSTQGTRDTFTEPRSARETDTKT